MNEQIVKELTKHAIVQDYVIEKLENFLVEIDDSDNLKELTLRLSDYQGQKLNFTVNTHIVEEENLKGLVEDITNYLLNKNWR